MLTFLKSSNNTIKIERAKIGKECKWRFIMAISLRYISVVFVLKTKGVALVTVKWNIFNFWLLNHVDTSNQK